MATHTSLGEFVSIVVCSPNASAAEWKRLTDALPTVPPMREVQLPGNIGTIDLPDGWKITGCDASDGATVAEGPNHGSVTRAGNLVIHTPLFYRQMPSIVQPNVPMSDYLPPAETLRYLSKFSQRPGSDMQVKINQIVATQEMPPPPTPFGGRSAAALIVADETIVKHGESYNAIDMVYCNTYEMDANAWGVMFHGCGCDKSKFGQMLPTLLEIFASYRINEQQLVENYKAKGQALIDQAAVLRKASDDRFATIMGTAADREKARHASAMDTVEMLRGTRSVYDEKQGTLSDVDLNNSTGIVNALNGSAGYQRFHEVPLREQ